jgi:hypothetical protein
MPVLAVLVGGRMEALSPTVPIWHIFLNHARFILQIPQNMIIFAALKV